MQNLSNLAGLSLVLQPTTPSPIAIPLENWLNSHNFFPVWLPLVKHKGVTKVMPVLPNCDRYPPLLQAICQQLTHNIAVIWHEQYYLIQGIETYRDNLYAIRLLIKPKNNLPPTIGRAIHALFFKWLAQGNSALAEQLHQQDIVPFTLSSRPLSPYKIQIKITLLQSILLSPLLWGISQNLGGELLIAGVSCWLERQIVILASTTYEKLAQVPTQNSITLQFLSPTSFKQQKQIQLFPSLKLVFDSLLKKWNYFAPQTYQFASIEWEEFVSAFDLKTLALKLEGGTELGTQGWIKYSFSNPEQARIASILAQFAFYAGIGRKTTMGMGYAQSKN
ncbi:conserved hypothetical protein [Gloeothece citriformis PCC 7424]|uniref:CRISPR-associated protein Cas6 C-terminal domain-containing protein n=1 Tax=Gloeothece citriformis (strain PCC 7424) TaxID=65393 RepID=B7KDF7_GLOC7|nr:CRISPR system precrRNA processing endoribonuclease RAMP protein Cas6 [Gloeothece citriformis]ACK68977.1 conserved hypothetical protein [Gloeothece citriformis PCC 7424]